MTSSISKDKIAVLLFFGIFLILGLTVAKDYGAHLDEFNSHDFGVRWYQYTVNVIAQGGPLVPREKEITHDIIHGPAIEMSFAFLADLLHLQDSRQIILLRHYGTWLLFFISVIFFYLLCQLHFNSWKWSLLGCLILVLHPRIFANSFYNSVDMALLSFYIISLYTLVRYLQEKSLTMAVCHAFTCAILIDIRLIGVVMPFLSCIFLLSDMVKTRHDQTQMAQNLRNIFAYTLLMSFFIILFWPYLWRNPVMGILEIIQQTPRIQFGGMILYFGEYIKATELPWHYLPVWIVISTPVLYHFFFVGGGLVALKHVTDPSSRSSATARNELLFFLAFLFPLLLVIAANSTLYDSWRHMFFIYPAFVLVALTGIAACRSFLVRQDRGGIRFAGRVALASLILVSFLSTGIFMIQSHPHQNVYFNLLLGKNMEKAGENFDLDYWGLSYRTALEYILKNDQGESIRIFDAMLFGPMINNIKILPASERKRVCQVWTPGEAKYLITVYRQVWERADSEYLRTNYRWGRQTYPYPNEFFSIRIGAAKIISVFKIKS
jgi:hypothetical protein